VKEKPATPAVAIGVGLKDVSAANLRLTDIAASGTGVKMEGGRFTGDVDIRGERGHKSTGVAQEDWRCRAPASVCRDVGIGRDLNICGVTVGFSCEQVRALLEAERPGARGN
jgi:hypothetical protein